MECSQQSDADLSFEVIITLPSIGGGGGGWQYQTSVLFGQTNTQVNAVDLLTSPGSL